jgi:hypothetical protein
MEHQFEYTIKNIKHSMKATLVAEGENGNDAALTKAIGLIIGSAAKAILLDNIKLKGLHIPTVPEIYDPILSELLDLGIAFHVEETKVYGLTEDKLNEKEQNPMRAASSW